ncbi:MAG: TonB-dependent receptor [Allosphingosinicella sp.]
MEEEEEEEEEGRVQPASAIVVTARRLDAARTRIDAALGATVYTLTNEAVENRPGGETGNLSDILAQVPGVIASGDGLVIRGSRASQVRVNDVIIPEAVSDPADHLSSRLAETTRLMTGTLPAQFGFAPAGVISVTTKSGLYQHGGQVELFGGSGGMLEPAAEWSGSLGGTSLFGSASLERDRSILSGQDGIPAREARRAIEGLVFADHVVDAENRVSLIFGGSLERRLIGATGIPRGTERSSDGYAIGTFQHSDGELTVQTSLFAGIASQKAAFALPTRDRRSSFGTQIDATRTLASRNTLRFGLLAGRSTARELELASRRSNSGRTAAAFYVQDEWKVAPAVTVNPGVRVEWLRGFGNAATVEPRTSLVWSRDGDLTAHVGYARYASAPPLGETGAADLADEKDDYYDAGLQRRLGPLTLGFDAYWRAVRNYIVEHRTPGSTVSAPFGFRRARIRGIELSATYARRRTTAWANLAVGGATGKSIVGGEGLFSPVTIAAVSDRSLRLATERPVTGSAGFTRRFGHLTLSADTLASSGAIRSLYPAQPNGARYPAYALLAMAAVYHARLFDRPADLRIDLTNLTDVRYATSAAQTVEGGWTRQGRGRAIIFGIEQGF